MIWALPALLCALALLVSGPIWAEALVYWWNGSSLKPKAGQFWTCRRRLVEVLEVTSSTVKANVCLLDSEDPETPVVVLFDRSEWPGYVRANRMLPVITVHNGGQRYAAEESTC